VLSAPTLGRDQTINKAWSVGAQHPTSEFRRRFALALIFSQPDFAHFSLLHQIIDICIADSNDSQGETFFKMARLHTEENNIATGKPKQVILH